MIDDQSVLSFLPIENSRSIYRNIKTLVFPLNPLNQLLLRDRPWNKNSTQKILPSKSMEIMIYHDFNLENFSPLNGVKECLINHWVPNNLDQDWRTLDHVTCPLHIGYTFQRDLDSTPTIQSSLTKVWVALIMSSIHP